MAGPSPEQTNQLIALYRQGRLSDALGRAETLAQQYPDAPFLLNLLGIFQADSGLLNQAVASYSKSVSHNPGFAEAHFNLGNVLDRLGKTSEAAHSYENAIRIKPAFAKAHTNLGAARQDLGMPEAAVKSYRKAIEIDPNVAEAHNNLGFALDVLKKPSEALAACRQALRIRPDYPDAYNNLGNAQLHLGDTEAAIESFHAALAIAPGFAEAHRNLSELKTYSPDDAQVGQMLELLASPNLAARDSMLLNFALGKAHTDLGSYDVAFDYFSAGNLLRKQELNFNISVDRARLENILSAFSGDLSSITVSGDADEASGQRVIFILGMPRSGTSLVEQILASHSGVFGAGELELLDQTARTIELRATGPSSEQILAVREAYLRGQAELGAKEPCLTDKLPFNFWWIGLIFSALPEARVVHVKRDARAVCWSNYRHYFRNAGIGFTNDLKDLSDYYKLYARLMDFWHQKFPGRIYDLDYETLTRNQERETRKLLDYVGLDWEDQCLEFYTTERAVQTASASQVRKAMYQGSSEEWRNFEHRLEQLVESLTGY